LSKVSLFGPTPILLSENITTMPAKSRFTRLDAFTKTVDEARIRTTSGGIVTIASLLIVLYLAWGEWADYRRIVVHPELIVDKGRVRVSQGMKEGLADQLDRREDGDTSEHNISPDSLRAFDIRCDGCLGRAADRSYAWSQQGQAFTCR
jgi:hypothetical protein